MKKIILSLFLSLFCVAYSFAYDVMVGGIYYNLVDGKAIVTYKGSTFREVKTYSGSVVIPTKITVSGKEYPVTTIGDDAFWNCSSLTSVTIPNSVTTIGKYAFSYCSGLTSVTIPNSVTSIGGSAFYECSGLTSVTIPNSVTSIGGSAFYGCSGLTSVTIPNSVTTIGEYAFSYCSGLTSVNISSLEVWCKISFATNSSNPLSYAHNLYLNEEKVTDLVIPNSVTNIGDYAFQNCSGLTSVTIPNSVTNIGGVAFSGCSGLTSVTIPNSVTNIGDYAFQNCSGLTSVTIPNSVTSIGEGAFSGCSGLTSVTIPNSVTSIGGSAFSYCSGLTSVTIPNSVTSIGGSAFSYCSGLTSVTIPNSVTSIRGNAFSDCSGLTSVTIPNSVTSIGGFAFSGCSGLTSVTIPNSVTSIGDRAFWGCSNVSDLAWGSNVDISCITQYCKEKIEKLTFLEGITSIGERAFSNWSGLTSVTIGNSVTSIEKSAFKNCSGLTSVNISSLEAWCKISFETYDSNPLYYAHNLYLNEEKVTDLVIPNSVTTIGEYAFYSCSGLTSVTIPNSVTSIGRYAFAWCLRLTSVNISSLEAWCKISFATEDSNPLYYAHNLYLNEEKVTDLVIPNSVTSIGGYAFSGCSDLTSVIIPNSVTSIGRYAFEGCVNLPVEDGLQYADTYLVGVADKNIITCDIKEGTRWIGERAFSDCSGLTSVTIPNSVTSIEKSAFQNCSGLTSVNISSLEAWCKISFATEESNPLYYAHNLYLNEEKVTDLVIPNSVTSIGGYAFSGCSDLTSVTIPNSVTSIGNNAFSGCSKVSELTWGCNVNISCITSNCKESLKKLTLLDGVINIGEYGFSGCSGLKEIHSNSVIPPSEFTDRTFHGMNTTHCKLYVPIGTKDTYAFAEGWRLFSNIIEENVISDGDNKCASPSIAFEDGQLKFTSETPNAKFLYTITDTDIKTSLESCEDGNVKLSATYTITAYAEAEGYSTSDATTATLIWLDARLDGTSTDAKEISVNAKPLLITQAVGFVTLSGLQDGEKVSAFDVSGKQIATSRAIGAETMIDLSSQQGKAAIIKIGGKSVKLMIK